MKILDVLDWGKPLMSCYFVELVSSIWLFMATEIRQIIYASLRCRARKPSNCVVHN